MMRKRWWLAAFALVLLPFVALGIALAVMDPDALKPRLATAIQDATGRTLTLDGPLRISRSLWPTIEVSDVKLANLPGGTRPDMARAERIEARLSLPDLLWRRLQVTKLTLIGPNILFEQVGAKPNWVFDTGVPASPGRVTLGIQKVYVQNGMVTVRLPGRTRVVGIRSLAFQHAQEDGPIDVSAELVYSDNQPFRLSASARPTGTVDDPWDTRLDFAAFDTTASAKGSMTLAGGYDLQVTGESAALEKLNALLPEMQLPTLRNLTVETHLANGKGFGDFPVIGATALRFASGDFGSRVPGLALGDTQLHLATAGAPVSVVTTGHFAGEGFGLNGNFVIPEHPEARASVPVEFTLAPSAGKGSLAVKGKLSLDAGQFAGLDASVTARAPALAPWRQWIAGAAVLTEVALDGRVVLSASDQTMRLLGAKLKTAQGALAGDVTVGLGPVIALDGKLASATLDLDAPHGAPAAAGEPSAGPLIPDTALPWATLRGPAVKLALSIDALALDGRAFRNVDLAAVLQGGRLDASRIRLTGPAGPIDAAATLDAATQRASLTLHAPGLPLQWLTQEAGLPGSADGTIRVDLALHATGGTARALAGSLTGTAGAAMANGSLANAALLEVAAAALKALNVTVPPQGRTQVNCFSFAGTFDGGVGRVRTALNSTYLSVEGAGQVDLGQETVAMKLHPMAQLSGSQVSVPVLLEGPFRALNGRLDANGFDKLGLLIDSWFGGDKPVACAPP